MGRLAEALERAEQKRAGAPDGPSRLPLNRRVEPALPLPFAGSKKWSEWYGAARTTHAQLPVTFGGPVQTADPVAGLSSEIVCYYQRSSLRSEQYRSLRTRLLSANPRAEHRTYAISSALPKEGKSVTTVNLGFSFAELPHLRVLMVDGDFRQTKLAELLNVDPNPGLADLMHGQATYDQIIRPTPLPNLFVAPVGRTQGRSATDLFSRKDTRAVFERFRREFHYVIVDTPPAATVADVGIIGQMMNGVIFVVRMHRTPEPVARRAIKHILSNNVNILGSLLIGDDEPSSGYGRHYGYYPYGGDDD